MELDIITPDKKLFSGKIFTVKLPGTKGSFAILQNHAPIISTLKKGTIKVIDNSNKTYYFEIEGGVAECRDNKIAVLIQSGKMQNA
ncbi:MAG: ATP synthase F1 subunit epsilon [Prolixibacteraceae bacterium]|nr:ATP synthase F1 subunit epsilon [Prolixibacteraceae bacterium]MBN2650733.1 ATP synthase F1 subunit epsilon [Prolixibacteraceae bacterium]